MVELSEKQIKTYYENIKEYHSRFLKDLGVVLPSLKRGSSFTKDALVLVYLFIDYPNTRIVSKTELTEFVRKYYPSTLDVQQARHLGAQKGWFIASGTRKDSHAHTHDIGNGKYKLISLEISYPGFTASRRNTDFDGDEWESIKEAYKFRCATCGSKEGEPHFYWENTKTVLQKGHMDPSKPLKLGNIIPQCEKCNRADRDNWIYDAKGRVVGVANPIVIDRCSTEVKEQIYKRLYDFYDGKNPNDN